MGRARLGLLALAACAASACARETTGPDVVPGWVSWLEWPAAVTSDSPGTMRIWAGVQCPYRAENRVYVTGSALHVVVAGRDPRPDAACVDLSGSEGAAARSSIDPYDTLLPLPALSAPASELPAYFAVWAPMSAGYAAPGDERLVGYIELRSAADTTARIAGRASVWGDSGGCWWAQPIGRSYPAPRWAFARALPLVEGRWYAGYLSGHFIAPTGSTCGEPRVIEQHTLEISMPYWSAGALPAAR